MNRTVTIFWGSAVGVALVFAAAAAALLPYDALRLYTAAERERAWLLTVWTGGVMAILFGLSATIGWVGGIGFRDVVEAGSVKKAAEKRRQVERQHKQDSFHSRFDWWLISTGVFLVLIYFAGWLALRS
jgi:hypothetical protein